MLYALQRLLEQIQADRFSGHTYCQMQEVIALPAAPARSIILRFDVERLMEHHLVVARQLALLNIRCTMYVHTRRECYEPKTLHAIQALGHEIGYHHECLDRCRGDYAKARDLFLREVAIFRRDGFALTTVCAHGEAGLPKRGYTSNRDLFQRYPDLLMESGVQDEVYHWIYRTRPLYATDTFKQYRQFWKTIDKALISERPLMVLAHLHRWHRNPINISLQLSQDVMHYCSNYVRKGRSYQLAF